MGANTNDEEDEKSSKYPKSVFFIVSNEFCERFTYYGMRTVLTIYLTNMLLYSDTDAKIIYHTFTMLVYFFPLLGAILADSYLGKFNTILYLSIVYAIGSIVLSLTSTPPLNIPEREISILGLLLIALGTGGIKPCVSAFGGDQFKIPQQAKQLAAFFSMFYFAINSGSLVSTFITPMLRNMSCFGSNTCFTLAFGVPGILMIISIVIFVVGKRLYKIKEPEGNMFVKVSKCIGYAIKNKHKSTVKKEHWLEYAEDKYGAKLVNDIKALLRVLVLYIPLPVFWALFDQQGTGWTFQARRMDGDIGFFTILPDQMQVVNPILILLFIPIFEYGIYPLLDKIGLLRKPLHRLTVGGILAAVAFGASAAVSIALETESPVLPEANKGHLIFYNNYDCDMRFSSSDMPAFNVTSNDLALLEMEFSGTKEYKFTLEGSCIPTISSSFNLTEGETIGYFLKNGKPTFFVDSQAKDNKGFPLVRILFSTPGSRTYPIKYVGDDNFEDAKTDSSKTESLPLSKAGKFKIHIGNYKSEEINFKNGGVYTILVNVKSDSAMDLKIFKTTPPNSINMLWLLPQYIIITMGEIMFSITGLEFSYSQSPLSMKSVLQAMWLLTTAFGNLIVVIIESADPFEKQSNNFFLYAGLMLLDMVVFFLMSLKYKYVEKEQKEDVPLKSSEEKNGINNDGFVDTQKYSA